MKKIKKYQCICTKQKICAYHEQFKPHDLTKDCPEKCQKQRVTSVSPTKQTYWQVICFGWMLHGNTLRGKENYRIVQRDWKKNQMKNPITAKKLRARYKVHYAVNSGKLKKSLCEDCNNKKVEAYHSDYNKPLEVNWLCKTHHEFRYYGGFWHREGMNMPRRKGFYGLYKKSKERLSRDLENPIEQKRLGFKGEIVWKNYVQNHRLLFNCGSCGNKQFEKQECNKCGYGVLLRTS